MDKLLYRPGAVVLQTFEPFIKVLFNDVNAVVCDACFKGPGDGADYLQKCASCGLKYYCSKTCQKTDWKNGHKLECKSKAFKNSFNCPVTVDLKVQLFRLMAFIKMNPKAVQRPYTLYNEKIICFDDILNQNQARNISRELIELCEDLAWEIEKEMMENSDLWGAVIEAEYLVKLIDIIEKHSFIIYDESKPRLNIKLGSGIFVQLSTFKHSCKPNSVINLLGTRVEIRAIEPILTGEEPTICYITKHSDKKERHEILKTHYCFECHCERCEKNLDADVDFKKLNDLCESLGRCCTDPQFAKSFQQDRLIAKHEIILQMLRKLYYEFDDRVSHQYNRIFVALLNNNKPLKRPIVQKLIEDARSHILLTFGHEHPEFQQFKQNIVNIASGVNNIVRSFLNK